MFPYPAIYFEVSFLFELISRALPSVQHKHSSVGFKNIPTKRRKEINKKINLHLPFFAVFSNKPTANICSHSLRIK
jgi:hypothetical protein